MVYLLFYLDEAAWLLYHAFFSPNVINKIEDGKGIIKERSDGESETKDIHRQCHN